MHGVRLETPFLCGSSAEGRQGVDCPPDRPADDLLSCDAIGCHGGFDFAAPVELSQRHLRGSDGPSCYTCHGEEWEN